MRWMIVLALLAAQESKPTTYRFKKEDVGKVPAGWKAAQHGEGKGSVWKVVEDATAPSGTKHALAQTAKAPSLVFNICVAEGSQFADGEITVKFKSVAGRIDQGGGVVWRYQDAKNYYLCRYNPLEDNLRIYKIVEGRRIQLGTQEKLARPAGKWYSLSIKHDGEAITCYLDGKKYLEVKDAALKKAGQLGLWTKADAQTYFDELVVKKKG